MKRHAHSFKELRKIAERYYSDTGYCGVICLAATCQIGFGKAKRAVERAGRRHRTGTPLISMKATAELFDCAIEPMRPTGKTLSTAARNCPRVGIYWIHTTTHIACVENGVLIDWSQDRPSRHRVVAMYEITRNFTPIARAA